MRRAGVHDHANVAVNFQEGDHRPESLLLERNGEFSMLYASFDYINQTAKVALCGIRLGLQQATIARNTAGAAMRAGPSVEDSQRIAKRTIRFAGGNAESIRVLQGRRNPATASAQIRAVEILAPRTPAAENALLSGANASQQKVCNFELNLDFARAK